MKVFIEYTETSTGGDSEDYGDRYASRSPEYVDWRMKHAYLYRDCSRFYVEELDTDFDIKQGDIIYVVFVRFTTGCTFGSSHGNGCIVGAYKNVEDARKKILEVKDEYDRYKNDEKDFKYRPWIGYFESMEECDFQPILVM